MKTEEKRWRPFNLGFLLEKKKEKSEIVKDERFPLVRPVSSINIFQYIKPHLGFLFLNRGV